ncbi:hypothetical protein [Desulfosediminicola flagellatus]|uniref:hypothetical protein n=1 Tax=Desulfosediminicola flagellatus TaxID=2569541 RepID=UPI0010AD3533|nr:hypothetical protein [Desulfosediminicola flagellatus]
MKIKVCASTLLLAVTLSTSSLATVGDIDGDNLVGLPEAINALSIAAGGSEITTGTKSYNFLEYFFQDKSTYIYTSTTISIDEPPGTFDKVIHSELSQENGENLLVIHYNNDTDYVSISENVLSFSKFTYPDYSQYPTSPILIEQYPTPPIKFGLTNMKVGETLRTIYQRFPDTPFIIREYTFLGIEDVITPAGLFPDCIAIKRTLSNWSSNRIEYFAKGVGRVKRVVTGTSDNYYSTVEELISGNIDGTHYGNDMTLCKGTAIDSDQKSFDISISIRLLDDNTAEGTFNLHSEWGTDSYNLTSQDQNTFICSGYDVEEEYQCLSLNQNLFFSEYDDIPYNLQITCETY